MIASVAGVVAAITPEACVVEVGGVGLLVHCTPATLARLRVGDSARLAASLVVREDSLTLYGFADDDEKSVFEALQSATGVGPRLAQAVLSVLAPDAVRRAVADDDLTALTRVPGIGKKGAQRICLELKDRLGPPHGQLAAVPAQPGRAPLWSEQVRSALAGLGYSQREADDAVDSVADLAPAEPTPAEIAGLLRSALRVLRPAEGVR